MIIKQAELTDVPELLTLYQELLPFEMTLVEAKQTTAKMIRDETYFLAVAKENQEIVGTALGICCQTVTVPFLVIEDVIVKEETRGKGVGRQLMMALDDFATKNNCAYAVLVSSGYRKAAHQFYESVGFTEDVRGFRKVYVE